MADVMEQAVLANLPKGQAWTPDPDLDMQKFYEGVAENWEVIRSNLANLAYIRDPNKTIVLEDLEKEYGYTTDIRLTEAERRQQLAAFIYALPRHGSEDDLQEILRNAGHDVYVHQNDPAVDPGLFLNGNFQVALDNNNAYLGDIDAFLGISNGELIVIGDTYDQLISYEVVLDGEFSYLGDDSLILGYFTDFTNEKLIFPIPTNSDSWPFIFFVGGSAVRDGITGELTSIQTAMIPHERRSELIRNILRYKPMFTWCGLIVNYI